MGRLGAITILLAVALVGTAGCIGFDEGAEPASTDVDENVPIWHELALPFGPSHDHTNASHHADLSTPNFEILAYDPLVSDYYGESAGAYFCGNAGPVEDGRRLAVTESRSDVAFALADVTDPTAPEWLGEFVMQTTHVYDLAVVPNGKHVILVTSNLRSSPTSWLPNADDPDEASGFDGLLWDSACTEEPVELAWSAGEAEQTEDPVPRPMSIILVDITDPEQPEIVEHQPLAGNGHSVYTNRIDDEDWALVTTSRLPSIGQNSASFYKFYRVTDVAGQAHLELVSTFKPGPSEEGGPNLGPRGHDGRMKIHPGTGDLTAFLAGGDRFTTVDFTDPNNPEELGRWTVAGSATPADGGGTMHSAYPIEELWNGTHYTVIGPEHGGHPDGAPSGIVWVMDTTDPREPEPVGAWTLPAQVQWNGTYQFSNHYLTVVNKTLFASMYHGGVWAIDLSPLADGPPEGDGVLALESIGVFVPNEEPPNGPAVSQRWSPTFEEVEAQPDGTMVSFSNEGLYTFAFDEDNPIPSPEPWDLANAIEEPVIER